VIRFLWNVQECYIYISSPNSANEIAASSNDLLQLGPEGSAGTVEVLPGDVGEDVHDGGDLGLLGVVKALVAIPLSHAPHKKVQKFRGRKAGSPGDEKSWVWEGFLSWFMQPCPSAARSSVPIAPLSASVSCRSLWLCASCFHYITEESHIDHLIKRHQPSTFGSMENMTCKNGCDYRGHPV